MKGLIKKSALILLTLIAGFNTTVFANISADFTIGPLDFKIITLTPDSIIVDIIGIHADKPGENLTIVREYEHSGQTCTVRNVDCAYESSTNSNVIGGSLSFEDDVNIISLGNFPFNEIVFPGKWTSIPPVQSDFVTKMICPSSLRVLAKINCPNLTEISYSPYVHTIERNAFRGCQSLSHLEFTDSLKNLGAGAFFGCSNLKSLDLGHNIKRIGDYTFYHTALSSLSFLEGVEVIEKHGLAGMNNIVNAVLPNSLEKIYSNLISGTNLKSISFGDNIKSIPSKAIEGKDCPKLERVEFSNNGSLKDIDSWAFYVISNFSNITIPSSVDSISAAAFYQPKDNFEDSPSEGLPPSSLVYMYPFVYLNYHFIYSPFPLVIDGGFTMRGEVRHIYLDRNIVTQNVKSAADYRSILDWAKKVTFGENVTTLPNYGFAQAKTLEIFTNGWPENLVSIGNNCFESLDTNEIVLPAKLEFIGDEAFRSSTSLKSLILPESTKHIGARAFENSKSLQIVQCFAVEPPVCDSTAFANVVYAFARLEVPNPEAYRNAPGWRNFRNIVTTGIDDITADGAAISVENGTIKIEGADRAEIYAADGRLVFSGSPAAMPALPSGLYLVRAGTTTAKIVL